MLAFNLGQIQYFGQIRAKQTALTFFSSSSAKEGFKLIYQNILGLVTIGAWNLHEGRDR